MTHSESRNESTCSAMANQRVVGTKLEQQIEHPKRAKERNAALSSPGGHPLSTQNTLVRARDGNRLADRRPLVHLRELHSRQLEAEADSDGLDVRLCGAACAVHAGGVRACWRMCGVGPPLSSSRTGKTVRTCSSSGGTT
jgi:hypothetical protein